MAELLTGIRVVVVDDHDDSRELLEQALRFHGASVTSVASAADALEAIAGAHVVITDLALPGEDGIWLLEQVNRLEHPIPVIVVSGYAEVQHDRLAAAPFARKLLKPIEPDRVCGALLEVLRAP